jgi:probable HAF family extracellular repeat protein
MNWRIAMKRCKCSNGLVGFVFCFFLLSLFVFQPSAYPASSDYYDTVQKLYIGYYQRPADPGGLVFWANGLAMADTNHDGNLIGENITWVLEQFAFSSEARALNGGDITTNNIATAVDRIYLGLFGRHAEPEGLTWWVNSFNSGASTPASILWELMKGAQGMDAQTVQNRLAAAKVFTTVIDPDLDGGNFRYRYSGNGDATKARDLLSGVTSDSGTIPTQQEIQALLVPTIFYTYTILFPDDEQASYILSASNNKGEMVGFRETSSETVEAFLFLYNGTYTVLPPPEGCTGWIPRKINDNGQIIGECPSWGPSHLYNNGTYTALIPKSNVTTTTSDLNDNGEVVGTFEEPDGTFFCDHWGNCYENWSSRGFLYSNGIYTTLLPEGWTSSYASKINNFGEVVGSGSGSGFIFSKGTYIFLLPGGWMTADVEDINNNGEVVGFGFDALGRKRGFLYSEGTYTVLLPEGWDESALYLINDNSQVIGIVTDTSGQYQGFLYGNGVYTMLLPEGWKNTQVTRINNTGQLVGVGDTAVGLQAGFLYDNGAYTTLLPEGWTWVSISGFNENAQVIGWGMDGSNHVRSFIATPHPLSSLDYLIGEVKEDLAQRLSIDAAQISLIKAEDVVWPDGCLGCQQPGMGCTLLAEDGYRIQLDFDGTIYEYHSGRDTHFIYCENPISPIILRP